VGLTPFRGQNPKKHKKSSKKELKSHAEKRKEMNTETLRQFRQQYIRDLEGQIAALMSEVKAVKKALRIERQAQQMEDERSTTNTSQ